MLTDMNNIILDAMYTCTYVYIYICILPNGMYIKRVI